MIPDFRNRSAGEPGEGGQADGRGERHQVPRGGQKAGNGQCTTYIYRPDPIKNFRRKSTLQRNLIFTIGLNW